jgi:PAS domain S-box-containing protein
MTVRPLRLIIARYAALAAGLPFLLMLLLGAFWLLPQVRQELDDHQRQLALAVATQVESCQGNSRDRLLPGGLELARLTRYLDRISILKNQKIFVLDGRGQVIADRDGSYTARQLNLGRLPMVRQGLKTKENRSLAGEFDFEGRQMAGSLYRIPDTSWSVLVAQPREEAARQVLTSANIAGLGLVASLLLAAGLTFPFTRTLVRRFEELAEHARFVEEGTAPLAWPKYRISEFNNLAASLQRMSGTLEERAALLEEQVQVRRQGEKALREKNLELAAIEEQLRQQVGELFLAQAQLKKSEEAYRTVADWTYDWEYWISPEKKFLYTSPSCERITGYPAQAFLCDPELYGRIINPDDRQKVLRHLEDCATPAELVPLELETLEFRLIARDGTTIWIEHSCRPVFSEQGSYLGRRACNRDITERRMLEQ